MDKVKLKGFPIQLKDDFPEKGIVIEDFTYVKPNLNEECLYDCSREKKLIFTIPSIDTALGLKIVIKFSQLLKDKDLFCLLISKDLPFAVKRVFAENNIKNIEIGSDYRYGEYGEDNGVEMIEGALRGLLANSVIILNKENKIEYSELVEDIFFEPNYDKIIKLL